MNKSTRSEQIERLKNLDDQTIDFSDIAPITQDMLAQATVRKRHFTENDMNIIKEIPYLKKIQSVQKERLHARIDSDILQWFKAQGRGYQTHINSVLRAYYENNMDKN